MHKIEVVVDKVIPPCLVVLLVLIVLELGFHDFVVANNLGFWIELADYFIIGIFVVDLIFKYIRTRDLPTFLKKYWLDILAVFPFFLLFRIYEITAGAFSLAVSETATTAQHLLHEGLEVEKESARILREGEKLAKISRSSKFMKFLRPVFRIPRFFKAVPKMIHFYEKPTGEHHEHEFKPKYDRKGRVKEVKPPRGTRHN
ncbi:ion transporter [Candidatus Woesearchaeota archaeon]|nr:ion transporter [Candidatus Woesearchaeota archaeon]